MNTYQVKRAEWVGDIFGLDWEVVAEVEHRDAALKWIFAELKGVWQQIDTALPCQAYLDASTAIPTIYRCSPIW